MPQDAPPNGSAPGPAPVGPWSRVAGMQAKLHRWAAADPGRRFDDLFNFVHDPATLYVAYCRVEGNRGANTPSVDGMTVRLVEERAGVQEFLDDLRAQLKAGTFRPLPVRRAHDAIAEIHRFGTHGYQWVLDADVEAAFEQRHQCSVTGSNRRPLRCGRNALPSELTERAPRRTRTSNDGFVVRHDLRFTRGAWVPARGNEPRPLPCRGSALPLSYAGARDTALLAGWHCTPGENRHRGGTRTRDFQRDGLAL
jgi:hypothetical protein